jgi:Rps23 Pro-64 3,4-dihydroxylase Tpa1-like proline 4-hydroxylase
MNPLLLAERIIPDVAMQQPFPHFVCDEVLPRDLAEQLLDWMEHNASWRLHSESFFEQYELDMRETAPPIDCSVLFAPDTLHVLAKRLSAVFRRNITPRLHVTAHKLLGGQTIGIHTDEPRGDRETHRLLIQLNRGWHQECGGELLLLNGNNIETLQEIVPPLHNRSVGFEMSAHSFHAVAKVNDWSRYTLIYSFWANDQLVPDDIEHVPMTKRKAILDFLRDHGAETIGHSGNSFLDHLEGVERVLDRWGTSLDVRMAGLLHSIYGTEGFQPISKVCQEDIEGLVGPDAELLIRYFCNIDPQKLIQSFESRKLSIVDKDGVECAVKRRHLDALLLIHLANNAEQLPRLRYMTDVVAADYKDYLRVRALIPSAARVELDTMFDRLTHSGVNNTDELLFTTLHDYIVHAGADVLLCGQGNYLERLNKVDEYLVRSGAGYELRSVAIAQALYGWKANLKESNRDIIRMVAGEKVERLAWIFACTTDDDLKSMIECHSASHDEKNICRDDLEGLLLLSAAEHWSVKQ